MAKVGILTDSNSGVTQEVAAQLGIEVIPMPFYIGGEVYKEGINLTQEEFYKMLEDGVEVTTSQPSPGEIMDTWDKMLETYDEIVFIPMSSGLSGTCETATMLANDYDGRVQVVDNQRISATMKQSAQEALAMANKGMSAAEIKQILERDKLHASIYITLETLKYLKKGGRITAAAAAIGTILNLKPVLQIQGEKLDAFSKARGKAIARKTMIKAIKDDLDNRFADAAKAGKMSITAVGTDNEEESASWLAEVKEAFPEYEIGFEKLSLSVACHIGGGALAITCTEATEEAL